MKMFLNIIKYRFISSVRHPAVLICLTGAVLCSLYIGIYSEDKKHDVNTYPIAVVDEDGGEIAEQFIENINKNNQLKVEIKDRKKAVSDVSKGKLDGAFILLSGFSKKIENGEIENLVEFVTPTVTTSAFPASEIVSASIVDIWLDNLTEHKIIELYNKYDSTPEISLSEIKNKIKNEYLNNDIINLEYIGDDKIEKNESSTQPIDKAVGVFAAFIIFAIILSSEWIFNFKSKALQDRFESKNSSMFVFYLGTQAASVMICMLFFIPILIFLSLYLSIYIVNSLYILAGILIFSLGICAISFAITSVVKNLTELIVVGVSIGISNILLSSLVSDYSINNIAVKIVSKALPGTYLLECYKHPINLIYMTLISFIWVAISYIIALNIKKRGNAFS